VYEVVKQERLDVKITWYKRENENIGNPTRAFPPCSQEQQKNGLCTIEIATRGTERLAT
jgi:hypothetical protein